MMRLLLISLFTLFAAVEGALQWETDYSEAARQSVEDQKPLLLFFTGSDWSGPAMKMENEVLAAGCFTDKVADTFRCVEIDFPQHKELKSSIEAQNLALKRRFEIEEYPALILLDASEREIVRLGYTIPESPEALAEELLHIVKLDSELAQGLQALPRDEEQLHYLYHLAQELSNETAQEQVLAAGVEQRIAFFQLEQYRLAVEAGAETKQMRKKLLESEEYQVHFTLALIDFQQRASSMKDPHAVIEPLEAYLARFSGVDQENVWRIEMMIAQFYLDFDEWGRALKHAETAYESAPAPFREEINTSLDYIREQIQ